MAYERTWAFSFDNVYASTTLIDQTRYQLWSLKAMLCGQLGGLTLGLWSVYSSSDGVTAGNADGPGVDRWLATYDGTKLLRSAVGATPKSWVVLKSPTMNGVVFYMTVSFEGANDQSASVYLSKIAPTAGTINVRASAADEWLVGAAVSSWNAGTAAPLLNHHNICLSSVGDFYFFTVQGGIGWPTLAVAVVAPVGCHASDLYPIWSYKFYNSATPGCFEKAQLATGSAINQPTRLASGAAGWIGLITMGQAMGPTSSPDSLTGKLFALAPWVVASISTTGMWHQRGRLPDTYVLPGYTSTAPVSGLVLRDGSNNITQILIGQLFVPANAIPNLG